MLYLLFNAVLITVICSFEMYINFLLNIYLHTRDINNKFTFKKKKAFGCACPRVKNTMLITRK